MDGSDTLISVWHVLDRADYGDLKQISILLQYKIDALKNTWTGKAVK